MFNIPSKKYKEWHDGASNQLLKQRKRPVRGIRDISIHFWAPDKRKTDLTNKAESILDLLVDNGILEDDNWFVVGKLTLYLAGVDKDNPRAEIEINEVKRS